MEENKFEIIDATPTYEELLELNLYVNRKGYVSNVIWGAVFIALAIIGKIFELPYPSMFALAIGVVLMLFGIAVYSIARTNAKVSYEKSRELTEKWYVYPDHIEYRVYRGDIEERFLRFNVSEISEVAVLKTLYAFKCDRMAFGVTKSELLPDSILHGILFPNGKVEKKKRDFSVLGVVYRILTVVSILYAIFTFSAVTLSPYCWWLAFIGFVFPVSLIVIFVAKRIDGVKISGGVLGIIGAVISAVLMTMSMVYGMTAHLSDSFATLDGLVGETGVYSEIEVAGVEFPFTDDYYHEKYKYFDAKTGKFETVENITYYYDDEAQIDEICSIVESGENWTTSLEGEASEFFETVLDYHNGDVFFIYNLTEGTYNSLPGSDGRCEYVSVGFNGRFDYIDVYKFEK